jgi:DNA-binding beta-propeller fold protein YncE
MRRALAILTALCALAVAAPAAQAAYTVADVFGRPGSGPGEFGPPRADFRNFRLLTSPGGIAFSGGEVLVADPLNARIQRFDANGRFLGAFGRKGVRPGEFLSPQGLVVHAGRVFVAMNGNDRIDVFSLRGRWQRMFHVRSNVRRTHAMARGAGRGQLHNPYGIVRSPNGRFHVADLLNARVQRFDGRGVSRGQIGGFGTGPGRFLAPYGVAADPAGNLWVSDRDLNRVQKFGPDGRLLLSVGETGSGPGDFLSPQGLATDRLGNVYVADTHNARVVKLAPDGRHLETISNGLAQPTHLAVAPDCAVWVADYRRVVKFAGSC